MRDDISGSLFINGPWRLPIYVEPSYLTQWLSSAIHTRDHLGHGMTADSHVSTRSVLLFDTEQK